MINPKIRIEDANIEGFRCFGILKETSAPTISSGAQLPLASSSDTFAEDPSIFKKQWKLTIQKVNNIFTHSTYPSNLSTKCFEFESIEDFFSESETIRSAILAVQTSDTDAVYALMTARKFRRPGVDLKHCGYKDDKVSPIDRPTIARTDADLEKLYAMFGRPDASVPKYLLLYAPCVYMEGNATQFLTEWRRFNNTGKPRMELVAQLDKQLLFSMPVDSRIQRLALNSLISVRKRMKDTKLYLVPEMVCDYAFYRKDLWTNQVHTNPNTIVVASQAARKEPQAVKTSLVKCITAIPADINICRRAVIFGYTLGIVTFIKTKSDFSSWIICFDNKPKSRYLDRSRQYCSFQNPCTHPGLDAVKVLETEFKDILQAINIGKMSKSNDILDVLRTKELSSNDLHGRWRMEWISLESHQRTDKETGLANTSEGRNVREGMNTIKKENDVARTSISHTVLNQSETSEHSKKRKRAADPSNGENMTEGNKAAREVDGVRSRPESHKSTVLFGTRIGVGHIYSSKET